MLTMPALCILSRKTFNCHAPTSRLLLKLCQLELPGCFWPLRNKITVKAVNTSRTSFSSSDVQLLTWQSAAKESPSNLPHFCKMDTRVCLF